MTKQAPPEEMAALEREAQELEDYLMQLRAPGAEAAAEKRLRERISHVERERTALEAELTELKAELRTLEETRRLLTTRLKLARDEVRRWQPSTSSRVLLLQLILGALVVTLAGAVLLGRCG